ncbi:MAG: acyl-CoA dehydrogenase family protein [Nitrospinota bacterium]|nr:acyl-CoA dehydrogenase family protein [Nitrospinota bacterium]
MDFAPEETHLALQRMANDFARQEILPDVEDIDRQKDPAVRFPAALLEKGSRLGLRTLALPEERGGGGADLLTLCFVGEEIGWGDLGVASTFAQDWCVSRALGGICGEAQFADFSSRFAADHAAHLTRTELSANPPAENWMPYAPDAEEADEDIPAGAAREGGGWALSGFASHVMNGAAARWILVSDDSGDSDDSVGEEGRRAFLVDAAEGGGPRVSRHHDPIGMRSCQDVALAFEDLRVSDSSEIPCESGAWARAVPSFFALPASAALGCARRATEHATGHARERVQGGKPIIEHQTVGFMLAENLMEMTAARRALQAAAWAADQDGFNGEVPDLSESYLTRVFVSEACERIARRSMEVWGGAGYMTEAPMERFVRDMTSFMHSGVMMNSLRARAMPLI